MDKYNFFSNLSDFLQHDIVDTETLLLIAKNNSEEGERATLQLLFNNIGLIVKTQARYISYTTPTFDDDDLLSTTIMGFIRAVQLYDSSRGVKFITYAFASMQFQIWRAIENQSPALRLPTGVHRKKAKIKKAINNLQYTHGKKPTIKEISVYCGMNVESVKSILAIPNVSESLERIVYPDYETALEEIIPDPSNQITRLNMEIDRTDLLNILEDVLSPSQYIILCMYYGLVPPYDGGRKFSEISQYLGITREHVRQIHAAALIDLFNSHERQNLYHLLV